MPTNQNQELTQQEQVLQARISNDIEKIVARRAHHLPDIDAKLEHLDKVNEQLIQLDSLITAVNQQLVSQQGSYYQMIKADPKMEMAFKQVQTKIVRDLLLEQRKKLEILRKRFERKTINIAMVGFERQGKSTFLQAISGLNSKCIPAYSGASCTGAVSVIHNTVNDFHVDMDFYTETEMVSIINEKLLYFFPEGNRTIGSIAEFKRTLLPNAQDYNDPNKIAEYKGFYEGYYKHVDDYNEYIDKTRTTLTDEDEVCKYVSQYEWFFEDNNEDIERFTSTLNLLRGKRSEEEIQRYNTLLEINIDGAIANYYQIDYYRYIAVKSVDIFKPFHATGCQKIDLIDTIGLGPIANADKIEAEMFRVLREDCDAAVDLFKPDADGGAFNYVQSNILDKIRVEFKDRNSSKWFVYVVNKTPGNKHLVNGIIESANVYKDNGTIAWVKAIDGKNVEEVKQELVIPLLKLITENLGFLDNCLMEEANESGKNLFAAYYNLTSNVAAVLSQSVVKDANSNIIIRREFRNMCNAFSEALRELDDKRRNLCLQPNNEIEERIQSVIDRLYDCVPSEEDIKRQCQIGAKPAVEIFGSFCDVCRDKILSSFQNVTDDTIIPLREDLKLEMVNCLYEQALLKKIPLNDYNPENGPSVEWLRCLVNEKIKDSYPAFYEAINIALDYRFNIEDSIEYDVTTSIGCFNVMNIAEFSKFPFTPPVTTNYSDMANEIWQEIINRIGLVIEPLNKCKTRFALIPNYSFATRVNNFRMKFIRNEQVKEEMEDFYSNNGYTIWRDELSQAMATQTAFTAWKEISNNIAGLNRETEFVLIKKED